MKFIPYTIGLDVGSTTVKAVVLNSSQDILWQNYRWHNGSQAKVTGEVLNEIESALSSEPDNFNIFCTGSGAVKLSDILGALHVQEVTALAKAVEMLHPYAHSAFEIGGQDAKLILFEEGEEQQAKNRKLVSMNDKCAGGTGATIDKIGKKLGLSQQQLKEARYDLNCVQNVAAKCGVFAETDITALQKEGVPAEHLLLSLFDAIVRQNLAVLARGYTLKPEVLLLGGPNHYLTGLQDAWRLNIAALWKERDKGEYLAGDLKEQVYAPKNGEFFAAIGAALYGMDFENSLVKHDSQHNKPVYSGAKIFKDKYPLLLQNTPKGAPLFRDKEDQKRFLAKYHSTPFIRPVFQSNETVPAYIGLDGGSTTFKGVLLGERHEVLAKCYKLAGKDPVNDIINILNTLKEQIECSGAKLKVLGAGVTGYSRKLMSVLIGADIAIVETVAHALAAKNLYPHVDVVCDVGGQDIKLMFLKNGEVVDFMLNTQCSAGTGYFLQDSAKRFGVELNDYASVAFSATKVPEMNYGCAVFLQSDIVELQSQGYSKAEILAGLARVLPKNIWLYIAGRPNMSQLGNTFVLQGGTQLNLAAVKAQLDYIQANYHTGTAEIIVNKYCGEAGAIGAAIEAEKVLKTKEKSSFIGFDNLAKCSYKVLRDKNTRCLYCTNNCQLTFIDIDQTSRDCEQKPRRLILGNDCSMGLAHDQTEAKKIHLKKKQLEKDVPNFALIQAKAAWQSQKDFLADNLIKKNSFFSKQKLAKRKLLRIGIPRVHHHYRLQPFFTAYFEALGIEHKQLVFSDYTSPELFSEGIKFNAVDPCFPAKLALVHTHNLLFKKHAEHPLDLIFLPKIDTLDSQFGEAVGQRSCPALCIGPEGVRAALSKEEDYFAKNNVQFLTPLLHLDQPDILRRKIYQTFHKIMHLSRKENELAVKAAYSALNRFREERLRKPAIELLKSIRNTNQIIIVLLGRSCQLDRGVNHDILDLFQSRGFPVLTPDSLPRQQEELCEIVGEEYARELYGNGAISDVWADSYNAEANLKLWATKFVARHPNLVALELSSFKCGSDSPLYSTIEAILNHANKPYFAFRDLDENKPQGAILTRVETICYALEVLKENLKKENNAYANEG